MDGQPVLQLTMPTSTPQMISHADARMITERLLDAAAGGAAVVWFGAELDELFAISDRLIVLAGGRASAPFTPPYDRAAIGMAMVGGHRR